ncbi:MAG: hypothetical protein R3E79_11260 [Caldilineaceae bacterium]
MDLKLDEISTTVIDAKQRGAYERFRMFLQTAAVAIRAGNYAEAEQKLRQAQQHWQGGELGTLVEGQLLKIQLHLAWYQRQFVEALQMAQHYLRMVDGEVHFHEQIYARLLLGNLYRDAGQFRTAHIWYAEAERAIEGSGDHSYTPWLAAQLAWLYLLEGRLNHARLQIEVNLLHTNQRQTMHFQVILAVLQMLDGEWEDADGRLNEALAFYERSGNLLPCCAIHLYLAYYALHQGTLSNFLVHLQWVLQWLHAHQLTAFPHWWHPKIMAEICTHALMSNLHPELVEYIVVHHLGQIAAPALKLLEKSEDIDLRRKAYRLYQTVTGLEFDPLAHLKESPSKHVLRDLLTQGNLCPELYPVLERELMTAPQRQLPNPTIVAVFGLYVNGFTRNDIAKRLACSMENVRNYITAIYQYFGLPAHHYKGREIRRQKLIELARVRGFIP